MASYQILPMKTRLLLFSFLFVGISLNAQTVNIPDTNFKTYLVGNSAINTNGDSEIQVTEAAAFTGDIECWSSSISDLTGISAFTNITGLFCQFNSLSSLDISQNTALTRFSCGQNDLDTLDVGQNTLLTYIDCAFNNLTMVDVSQNTALTTLLCYSNSLTSLNVANTNNANFISFDATVNPNLTCIQVDDVAYSNTNWPNLDDTASFSLNCGTAVGAIKPTFQRVNIYPNPAKAILHLDITATLTSIKLFDINGKVIKTFHVGDRILDISGIVSGVYFLEVSNEKNTSHIKVIKT